MKTSPENNMWAVSIEHKYEPKRNVTVCGEDPAVALARAMQRFKDNMKIISFER
jgi:hypothetical protein